MTSVCKLVETSILKWDLNRLRNTCVCVGGGGGRGADQPLLVGRCGQVNSTCASRV